MELSILVSALLFWLAYILYSSVLLIRNGKSAGDTVCVYMGNQADVAEWFIRSIYRIDCVMAGRLEVAVAVEPSGDDTGAIVRILSAEKEFFFIERAESEAVKRCVSGPRVLDVRGMDKNALLKGPLQGFKDYHR
jgi:hypothetical protein